MYWWSHLKNKGASCLYEYKVGDNLICEMEPTNKHSQNTIAVKNNDHVPEDLACKSFSFYEGVECLQSQSNHIGWETQSSRRKISTW